MGSLENMGSNRIDFDIHLCISIFSTCLLWLAAHVSYSHRCILNLKHFLGRFQNISFVTSKSVQLCSTCISFLNLHSFLCSSQPVEFTHNKSVTSRISVSLSPASFLPSVFHRAAFKRVASIGVFTSVLQNGPGPTLDGLVTSSSVFQYHCPEVYFDACH